MLKPRKIAADRRRNQKARTAEKSRKRLRMVEQLEDRRLMAQLQPYDDGLFYPKIGKATAFLGSNITQEEYNRRSDITYARSFGSGQGGSTGGGEDLGPFNTSEIEPNNRRSDANPLPLGTAQGKYEVVNVSGTFPPDIGSPFTSDEDYFRVELRAGDIIDARGITNGTILMDISIQDASGFEFIGNNQSAAGIYPPASPLSSDPFTTSLAVVIPEDGTYFIRASSTIGSAYQLQLRAYRPVLEAEPIGTKQILFVDFDGGTINRNIFGVPGTARLSPLSSFLPDWGLEDEDENAVIDSVLNVILENFADVGLVGQNGWLRETGQPGDYDFLLLNSRDHEDVFGDPHVSRVFVGGTIAEVGIPTIGLAQSVDIGNFETEESGFVLLDLLSIPDPADPLFANSINSIPLSGSASRIDAIGQVVGNITTHEFGHYLGNWHTVNAAADPRSPVQIMDSGGVPIFVIAGVGNDGIFGTADDIDVDFGVDDYDPFASAIAFGEEDTIANIAHGLSTGTVGGSINGLVFNDRNRNGGQNLGEEPLGNIVIFADLNQNGLVDQGEFRTTTNAQGRYTLGVPAGQHQIRAVLPTGFQFTAPSTGVRNVTIAVDQSVNANFGIWRPDPTVTGFKWNDLNGDGIRDAGEPALEGIYIYVDLDGDNRPDIGEPTAITAANGSYRLTPPTSGTYAIREVVPPGFIQTFPVGGEHLVTFNGVDSLVGLDFGNRVAIDFGDAPLPYPTLAADNGASAGVLPRFRLGTRWDIDLDGQPSGLADGDDTNGRIDNGVIIDDEDGITFLRPIVTGNSQNLVVAEVLSQADATGYLSAWIDFNQDGDWNDAGEQIITDRVVADGQNGIEFSAPAAGLVGQTFARFRLSNRAGVGPAGHAEAGEVEDYVVTITDTLNIAFDDNFTVSRNSVNELLDVLPNDFQLPGDTLRIISVSPGNQGGTARFNSTRDAILYTPRQNFVGREVFTYTVENSQGLQGTADVFVTVEFSLEDPIAIDDSFDVATNTVGFPLNVLANDLEGQGGALRVDRISSGPDKGGQLEIGSGGQSIRYTPARNFGGTETFTYVAVDSNGDETEATVTIHTLAGDRADDVAGYSFRVTDLNGNEISAVEQGENFFVEVYVDDLRTSTEPGAPPVINPGVFAAYLDVLYSGSLIGPVVSSDGSTFDQSIYADPYVQGTSGTGELPGLIDEFGAFSRLSVMDEPDPLLLARFTFEARAPGVAEIAGDPADNPPFTDTLFFNLPGDSIPIEQIRYGRASVEVVGDGVEFPFAVDNSFSVSVNSLDNEFDVLANDSFGSGEFITLGNVTQPMNGSAVVDDRGTANDFTDDVIRYTPNSGFEGTDQFRYVIRDDRGFESTATVTVSVGDSTGDDQIELRLEVTDTNGNSIDEIEVNQPFQLRGFVRDIRAAGIDRGVFAAYQDILYSSNLVSTNNSATFPGFEVEFSTDYSEVISGDVRNRNVINEIGSVQNGDTPNGSGEFLQFIIELNALSVGRAEFIGDPADILPIHDSLLFEPTDPVPFDRISYGFDSIDIVAAGTGGNGSGGTGGGSGFTNFDLRQDVNNDGVVSPIDALIVIHSLNRDGSRDLGNDGTAGGEGEGPGRHYYYDVDGNGRITPADALQVINYLNRNGRTAGGEGEGFFLSEDDSLNTRPSLINVANVSGSAIAPRMGKKVLGPSMPRTEASLSSNDLDLEAYLADSGDDEDSVDSLLTTLADDVANQWNA